MDEADDAWSIICIGKEERGEGTQSTSEVKKFMSPLQMTVILSCPVDYQMPGNLEV